MYGKLGLSLGLSVGLSLALIVCAACPAAAADVAMKLVLACEGHKVKMEVYVPVTAIRGSGAENADIAKPVVGAYALDLTAAGKGKSLEPVRVSLIDAGETLVVDQYMRKLPPTQIPIFGGLADFDEESGSHAKCGPFNE
jgi:hypothetical protein